MTLLCIPPSQMTLTIPAQTIALPPGHAETVPVPAANLLKKLGWQMQYSGGSQWWFKGSTPSLYFSWSEALVLEMAKFLEGMEA